MKPCLAYLELMNAVLDGEATAQQQADLQGHLACCPACAALYEDLSALRAGSDGLVVPAPAGLTDAVLEQIKAGPSPKLTVLPKRKNRWFPMVAAAAVCALAIWGTGSLDRLISVSDAPAAAPAEIADTICTEPSAAAETPAPAEPKEHFEAPVSDQTWETPDTLTEDLAQLPAPMQDHSQNRVSEADALSLVLDRILGELYSQPGSTVRMKTATSSTHITMENDDGTNSESTLTYTGLSPNGQYHCFAWTWEGQTEEEAGLFRYAVPIDDSYVIWAGESPLFDTALSE